MLGATHRNTGAPDCRSARTPGLRCGSDGGPAGVTGVPTRTRGAGRVQHNATEVTAAGIARLAGVGRAAVSNWRRRHAD
ncbi:hypothetical protein, partial [Streptomyces halstedii]|uniref:hypothetical protein n=1 Tax=Streptomyces halstedii TaxID=1944 RepID=UPI003D9E2D01